MATPERVDDKAGQGSVTTEARDHVLLVGIDRPWKRNALTPKILKELAAAYARFDHDEDLRCALLFGHGAVFSAGFDLTLLKDASDGEALAYGRGEYDPFGLSGERLSKPLMVAVHGMCFAGGPAPLRPTSSDSFKRLLHLRRSSSGDSQSRRRSLERPRSASNTPWRYPGRRWTTGLRPPWASWQSVDVR